MKKITFDDWIKNNRYEKRKDGCYYRDGMIWAINALNINYRIDTTVVI